MKRLLLPFLLSLFVFNAYSQNNYLDFDGINDNVSVAGSGNILAGSATISMSCKVFPESTNSVFPAFNGFAGYRNDSNFDFYLIQLSPTNVEARFRNSNGTAYTLLYTGLVLNQWNHFFLVFDGATLKLYSGSAQVASIPASGTAPTNNASIFKIGLLQFQSFNFYHNGYMDEVSLWSKALSATEISGIMNNNGEIADADGEAQLKLYYKFNQGTPYASNTGINTLIDNQGLLDGTLNNFALNGSTSNWGSQDDLASIHFNKENVTIFPNPTSNALLITSAVEINEIEIIDTAGRSVLHQKEALSSQATLNVSMLNPGIYFAKINRTTTIKFVKK